MRSGPGRGSELSPRTEAPPQEWPRSGTRRAEAPPQEWPRSGFGTQPPSGGTPVGVAPVGNPPSGGTPVRVAPVGVHTVRGGWKLCNLAEVIPKLQPEVIPKLPRSYPEVIPKLSRSYLS